MSYKEKHGAHSRARNTPNLKVIIVVIILMVAVAVGVIVAFSSVRGGARNITPVETAVDKHETDKAANSTEEATDSKKADATAGGDTTGESFASGLNAKPSDGSASSQKADRGGGKDDGSADNVVDANGSSDADSNNGQGGNDNSGGDSGNSSSSEGTWTGYY